MKMIQIIAIAETNGKVRRLEQIVILAIYLFKLHTRGHISFEADYTRVESGKDKLGFPLLANG